jgi:hypothetical protein
MSVRVVKGFLIRQWREDEERRVIFCTFIFEIGGFGIEKMVDLTPHLVYIY